MSAVPPFQPFELTAADYSLPMLYAGNAIFFRLDDPERGVPVLQEAIRQVTEHIPFLAGVVMPADGKCGTMEIRPAPNYDLAQPIPLCTLKQLTHLRLPSCLMPASGQAKPGTEVYYDRNAGLVLAPIHVAALRDHPPVIRFQINVLADGIILNLFTNHMVIDGSGASLLVEAIAVCCRAGPASQPSPDLAAAMDREMITRAFLASISPARAAAAARASGVDVEEMDVELLHDASLHDCVFSLSTAKVNHLRQAALQQWQGKYHSVSPPVSADDIVTAILSLCFARFRNQSASAGSVVPFTVQRMVDVRRRLQPPIPNRYIGNCFVMLEQKLELSIPEANKTPESFTNLIGEIACALRSNLNKVDDRFVRDDMARHPIYTAAMSISEEPDISVTSLRRLPIYEQDFGPVLGNVLHFQLIPYMNPERVCTLTPRRVSDETWEVSVTLKKEEMKLLRDDSLFRWIVESEEYLRFFDTPLGGGKLLRGFSYSPIE
ncbi:transferase family-domain-containing protein [Aspergillus desertorum]